MLNGNNNSLFHEQGIGKAKISPNFLEKYFPFLCTK